MTFGFLMKLIRPYRVGLLVLMALLTLEAVMALVLPQLAGQLGAVFLNAVPDQGVSGIIAALLGLLALTAGVRILSALLYARNVETILADLRQRLFDHMLSLPMVWHQSQDRGSLIALATLEIERLGHFVTGTLVSFLPLALTAIGATVLLFTIDPALALLLPILVPGFYVMTRILGRRLRGLGAQIQREHAGAVTQVEEMLELVPALKSLAAEPVERAVYANRIARLRELSLRQAGIYALVDPIAQFTVAAAAVVLLVFAGRSLQSGELTAAETISFLLYLALLVRPVSQLAPVYGQVQTARGILARLETTLSYSPEPKAGGAPFPVLRGDIRFEDVTFAYPERSPALTGFSLHVAEGETLALTGVNGAGKSTAIALLLGFQTATSGRVLLGGKDISALAPDHLRHAIGYVPQARYLRNATVRDNIALGQPDATLDQVIAAARFAQADGFIQCLPRGYDTMIGDRGVRLSGGQQQRIVLARALLKDPPILILDEATSMYDLEGEAAFIAECREALLGRTVIVITHRPASLALADRVVRLDAGRIVDEQRHERTKA